MNNYLIFMKKENFLYGFASISILGTMGFFVKNIYKYNITSNLVMLCVNLISLIFSFIFSFAINKNINFLKEKNKDNLLVYLISGGFINLFLCNYTIVKALEFIPAGIQTIITNSNPLFIFLISLFILNKKPLLKEIFSITLIVIGLFFVVGKITLGENNNLFFGIILALISSLCVAVNSIIVDRKGKNINKYSYWFFASCVSSVIFLIINCFTGEILLLKEILLQKELMIWIFFSGLLHFTLLTIINYNLYASLGAIMANIVLAMAPVASIIFNSFTLKENLNQFQILGCILIVLASLISSIEFKNK